MNIRTIRRHVLSGLLALAPVACDGGDELNPPEIIYGQQECDHCRMIISDERFAAACIVDRGGAEHAALVFDDINCLFDSEAEYPADRVLRRYVHDVNTRAWISAVESVFLLSDRLPTPMASGVAAAPSREALADLAQEHGGTLLDFAAIRAHFARPPSTSGGTAR
jgi:copper chaperone NosL